MLKWSPPIVDVVWSCARVGGIDALAMGMKEDFETGLAILCEANWTLLDILCTASGVDTVE